MCGETVRRHWSTGQFPKRKTQPSAEETGDLQLLQTLEMRKGMKHKVHSLIDKVYSRKNLELAWEKVKKNGGCAGIERSP